MPKPFVKWAGGKTQLLPELIPRLPKNYNNYYEPFLGGGALFLSVLPLKSFLSDLNYKLIYSWLMIKLSFKEVEKELSSLQLSYNLAQDKENFYYDLRKEFNSNKINYTHERLTAHFVTLNKLCFNGLYRENKKGLFNSPWGKKLECPELIEPCFLVHDSIQNLDITFKHQDYTEIKPQQDDFVYFDPPYFPLNVTSNFTSYIGEGFGYKEQVELSNFCKELDRKGVKFMLSNSDTNIIRELYKSFKIETIFAKRNINSKGSGRGNITEVIVRNYD